MPPVLKFLIGLAAVALSAWLFHGPAGYGARALGKLDAKLQPVVARQELPVVTASFGRDPMTRDVTLTGPANAFQREQFVEIIQEQQIRGLRSVAWDPRSPVVEDAPR